jgi:aryl-alcohol dehydrogenase-like predicted oxidoreductase
MIFILDKIMIWSDTAQMYGDGGAEKVVAEAIAERRTEVYLVSYTYFPRHWGDF